MVKFEIVAVGKSKDRWLDEAVAHYEKLLSKYARLKWTLVTSPAKSSALSPAEIKRLEAAKLREVLADSYLIALADSGKKFDSSSFAKNLEKLTVSSRNEIKIVIGGPYGLDDSILKQASEVWSLSGLTFSHQIVRIVLLEQLFRGFSILHGRDYHK